MSNVAIFCESMAVELLSISSTEYNPALLLKSHDARDKPFLDVLIENEQKEVCGICVSFAGVISPTGRIACGCATISDRDLERRH